MAVVADWSELPKDLLNLISERLDHEFDLIHFRSICSHWRSSSIPNHHSTILPFKFRIFNDNNTSSICYLSKRSIFLIKPPPPQQDQTLIRRPWLIRVTQNSSGKNKLYQSSLFPFRRPCPYPFDLDLNKLSVLQLGTDFIVDESLCYDYLYPKKVIAVTPFILAIILHNNRIVLLRYGDVCLTDIPCISSRTSIRDICLFKGRMYIVKQCSIKTFTVEPEDLSVQLVAKYVHNGEYPDRQFLVESDGELLLVDVHEYFIVDVEYKETLTINVFRLDEKENEWVKLTSLGDRVLFLADGCSFSASASDLYVAKGNCVIFMDSVFRDHNKMRDSGITGMGVFHLDQDRLSPLRDYPDYLNLFWPPPEWIVNDCMGVKQRKRKRDRRLF